MEIGEKRVKEYNYKGFVFEATIERVDPRPSGLTNMYDRFYNCSIKNMGSDRFSISDDREIKSSSVRCVIDRLVDDAKYWVDTLNKETDEYLFMEEEGFK